MKKKLNFLAIALIALMGISCASGSLGGTYKLESVSVEYTENADEQFVERTNKVVESLNKNIGKTTFTFNEDGSYIKDNISYQIEGTFKLSEDSKSMHVRYKGGDDFFEEDYQLIKADNSEFSYIQPRGENGKITYVFKK